MIYNLINNITNKVVGYTIISPFDTDIDIPDEELLEVRLECAIDDGYIPDYSYSWIKSNKKYCILI